MNQAPHFLSELIIRSTEYVIQELLEAEQTEFLGWKNYQRGGEPGMYRNGYKTGTGARRLIQK